MLWCCGVVLTRYANETSIFGLSLPARNGDYKNYHSGALSW